jgi:hypothetical protein
MLSRLLAVHWLLLRWLARRDAVWRSAGPAHRSDLAGQPACVGQRSAEQEFDLGVGAAQLVGGPPGKGVMNGWVEPQQDTFAFGHLLAMPWGYW